MKKVVRRFKKQTQLQFRVNIWGAVAYMASIFSYLLLGIASFRYLVGSSILTHTTMTDYTGNTAATTSDTSSNLISTIFAYGVTAAVVVLSAVLLMIFPYILSRYYARALRRITAIFSSPVSLRSLFYAKVVAGVAPLIGFMILTFIDPLVDSIFVYCYLSSVGFVLLTELLFYVQLRAIRRSKIRVNQVW